MVSYEIHQRIQTKPIIYQMISNRFQKSEFFISLPVYNVSVQKSVFVNVRPFMFEIKSDFI